MAECIDFLIRFQSTEPRIHLLYCSWTELLCTFMSKFIKKSELTDDHKADAKAMSGIDVNQNKNHIDVNQLKIGVNAKRLFTSSNIDGQTEYKMRTDFKKCYVKFTDYLSKKLPLDSTLLKDLQYINPAPEFRSSSKAGPAFQRIALNIGACMEANLVHCFHLKSNLSVNSFADLIKGQFIKYQNETIPESWYYDKVAEKYKSIDHYWTKVLTFRNAEGAIKYEQLAYLSLTAITLSHGNAIPERGFSINKNILTDKHALKEDTIVALRIVKDSIKSVEEIVNFNINRKLLNLCANARSKYLLVLENKKKLEEEKRINTARLQKEKEDQKMRDKLKRKQNTELEDLEKFLISKEMELKIANNLIDEGNKKLEKCVSTQNKSLQKKDVMEAQTMISMGLEKARNTKSEIEKINTKKHELLKNLAKKQR
ncbi:unnamed protein product [Brassicogethes aeneus]|uniref:HAT C-terminal dimerisation domain-containing protein n=1 Tax=Brassicogethes aeneus TaxID=1431903 RepID=A0A9P0FII7_BRAAE|nr:unnamed protein product [Brassicogethes aeneus]